jgi:hypothetical protein
LEHLQQKHTLGHNARDAMDTPEIRNWDEIAADFAGADLLAGNGLSQLVWPAFGYGSLFDQFVATLAPGEQASLRAFGSSNFEFILETLGRGVLAMSAFGLDATPLTKATSLVREGLIRAVESTHPRAADLPMLPLVRLSEALDQFNDVFTTNYDCLLYHVIMASRRRHDLNSTVRPYNDYFWDVIDDGHLGFKPFQNYRHYKHIYYLHGALFLFRGTTVDIKIRRTDTTELIERIADAIRQGSVPLFVSEGTAAEKAAAIYRSEYLRFANDHLAETRDHMVIYGHSLGSVDRHIVAAIRKSTSRVAFAVYKGTRSQQDIDDEVFSISALLGSVETTFFWSHTLFN